MKPGAPLRLACLLVVVLGFVSAQAQSPQPTLEASASKRSSSPPRMAGPWMPPLCALVVRR